MTVSFSQDAIDAAVHFTVVAKDMPMEKHASWAAAMCVFGANANNAAYSAHGRKHFPTMLTRRLRARPIASCWQRRLRWTIHLRNECVPLPSLAGGHC
jgi:hypothetical protein